MPLLFIVSLGRQEDENLIFGIYCKFSYLKQNDLINTDPPETTTSVFISTFNLE